MELPSNKRFGFFFTFVFLFVSIYCFYRYFFLIAFVFLLFAIAFLIISIVKSELLYPFNELWMRFGLLLAAFVSPIVMALIFFLVFTPMGLFMKLIGRDELRIKRTNKDSYWIIRHEKLAHDESFKNQF